MPLRVKENEKYNKRAIFRKARFLKIVGSKETRNQNKVN